MSEVENQVSETQKSEKNRGERGEVGDGSPSLKMKRSWAEAKKTNPRLSLKAYARGLIKDGDAYGKKLAQEWLDVKGGSLNSPRSEKNLADAMNASAATKVAKRKVGKK